MRERMKVMNLVNFAMRPRAPRGPCLPSADFTPIFVKNHTISFCVTALYTPLRMATMFRPPVQIHRLDVRLPRAKELNARPRNSKTVIPTLCRRVGWIGSQRELSECIEGLADEIGHERGNNVREDGCKDCWETMSWRQFEKRVAEWKV
jgi:hypothetical protein